MDTIKKKGLFLLLTTTIAQNLQCPPNWSLYPPTGSCYLVLSQPGGYTFDQGNAKCKELGAQITSIGSGAEQQFVSALSNRWQPSGGVQTLIGGKRTGPKAKDWTWSDGTAWNFTAWSKGNPDNGGAASGIGQGCIQLLSSPFGPNQPNWFQQDMWDDIGCGASFQQVVCKTSAKSAAPCDADWTYSATLNNCYKVVVQPGGFSFAQGDATCKKLGAQLTSVHSDAENAFIAQIANSTTAAGGSQTLIGGQRTGPKAGDWKWSDGTAWDYSAWGTGNPDNGGAGTGIGQGCIQAFYSPYGPSPPSWYQQLKWDDRNCENFVNAVCKKPINK